MACFGTVAFATLGSEAEDEASSEGAMPSWAEQGSEQRRVLVELGCESRLSRRPRKERN
jgi:hypothetical protein